MEKADKIDALQNARDLVVSVYEAEATDDKLDNGNLSVLNGAILSINSSIGTIEKRP